MANNFNKKICETLQPILFEDFLIHIARGKLVRFSPVFFREVFFSREPVPNYPKELSREALANSGNNLRRILNEKIEIRGRVFADFPI
jgi:hypothetical protein